MKLHIESRPIWQRVLYTWFPIALLCTLATTVDSQPSLADTIPEPVPWLADLECEEFFKILAQAQLEVFGDTVQTATLRDDTFLVDDLTVTEVEQEQAESAIATDSLSWILPAMKRQESELVRLPLSYDPGPSPRVVSVQVGEEIINFQVAGTLVATADSGIPQYESEIIQKLTDQGRLIAGPKLKRSGTEADSCDIPDLNDHRSLSLSTLYGEPNTSLIGPDEPLPFTHFETGAIDQNNNSSWEAVVNSILLAAKLQAQVLNVSIGGTTTPENVARLILAMNYAKEKGVMIFISAGNKNHPGMSEYMPACLYDEHIFRVLALQATREQPRLWPQSNTYCPNMPEHSVAAPGYNIPSINHLGEVYYVTGTSMAAPLASFVAGLNAIGADGEPLPLAERIEQFERHLAPAPGTVNPDNGRIDTFRRVVFKRCQDLLDACRHILQMPIISR